jgi:hypothetical protein
MSKINGSWQLESSENFDEFLIELGVGLIKRKLVTKVSPLMTFQSEDNKKWTINAKAGPMNKTVIFNIDEPYEEELISGEKVITTCILESESKQVQTAKFGKNKDKDLKVVREVVDENNLIMVNSFLIDYEVNF